MEDKAVPETRVPELVTKPAQGSGGSSWFATTASRLLSGLLLLGIGSLATLLLDKFNKTKAAKLELTQQLNEFVSALIQADRISSGDINARSDWKSLFSFIETAQKAAHPNDLELALRYRGELEVEDVTALRAALDIHKQIERRAHPDFFTYELRSKAESFASTAGKNEVKVITIPARSIPKFSELSASLRLENAKQETEVPFYVLYQRVQALGAKHSGRLTDAQAQEFFKKLQTKDRAFGIAYPAFDQMPASLIAREPEPANN